MIDKNDSMGLLIYNVHEISQQYRQKLKFMLGRSQEAVVRRCSVKKVFLEISLQNTSGGCIWISLSYSLLVRVGGFWSTFGTIFACHLTGIFELFQDTI